MIFGLPIAVVVALAIVLLQTVNAVIQGILLAQAGTPLTKEDVMAIIQEDWDELLVLNMWPELANVTWTVVEPVFSYLYDIITGLLVLFGVLKLNPDGTTVVVKLISPALTAYMQQRLTKLLAKMGKITQKK